MLSEWQFVVRMRQLAASRKSIAGADDEPVSANVPPDKTRPARRRFH